MANNRWSGFWLAASILVLAAAGEPHGARAAALPGKASGPGSGNADELRARNLLLICLDTTRADRLSCYGFPEYTTPVLDRMARQGLQVADMLSGAAATLISHATLFTSLLPTAHRAEMSTRSPLESRFVTLAEVLLQAGFETAAFTAGGQLDPSTGIGQGFQVYFGKYVAGEEVLQRARTWLDQRTGQERFFLFVHTYDAHHPYRAPAELMSYWAPEAVDAPLPGAPLEAGDEPSADELAKGRLLERAYTASVAGGDRLVGTLLLELADRGLLADTLVAFVSDHGEEFGEHGVWAKHSHTLHGELVQIPLLLFHGGKRRPGRIITGPAHAVDLAPTLLRALGVEPPATMTGKNLLEPLDPSRVRVSELEHFLGLPRAIAFTMGSRKLLRDPNGDLSWYNLNRDPGEQEPLPVESPADQEEAERFFTRFLAKQRAIRAAQPSRFPLKIELFFWQLGLQHTTPPATLDSQDSLSGTIDLPAGSYEFTVLAPDSAPEEDLSPLEIRVAGVPLARLEEPETRGRVSFRGKLGGSETRRKILLTNSGPGKLSIETLEVQELNEILMSDELEEDLRTLGYVQ